MTDAEARAILREHGHEPPPKGRLGDEWHRTAQDILDVVTSAGDPPGSRNGTGDEDQAAGELEDQADETEGSEPETPLGGRVVESRPRRPGRPRGRRSSLRDRLAGGARPRARRPRKARGPVKDRVPVDKFCASVWIGAARLAGYVSVPVSRTLELEAGLAGAILEDSIRGTFLDRIAQPAARAQATVRGLSAVIAPPALVLAIEACQGLPEERRQVRLGVLLPMLEQSLMVQARVIGERAEEIEERAEEDNQYRLAAQAKIAMIFAPPPGAPRPEEAAEDRAAAEAQNMAGV